MKWTHPKRLTLLPSDLGTPSFFVACCCDNMPHFKTTVCTLQYGRLFSMVEKGLAWNCGNK
jgi:hypothetical protein